jgi:DNA-damage-inducible protein D
MSEKSNNLVLFQEKEIRRVWFNNEWFYSIIDIIQILAETDGPNSYWGKMKQRDPQLSPIWPKFKLVGKDGKARLSECANTESILRIIQSIPSVKAEPFKLWLAQVGKERIDEIEDPELAMKRMRELYEQKGYAKEWIERRVRGIAVRQELTDEWKDRKVKEGREFSILTADIAKATFGLTPTQHKKFKRLKNQNLRDHMTDLELIFSMLGEAATTEITREADATGFNECQVAAKKGGKIAGDARVKLEAVTGKKVVTVENFLEDTQKRTKSLNKKNAK